MPRCLPLAVCDYLAAQERRSSMEEDDKSLNKSLGLTPQRSVRFTSEMMAMPLVGCHLFYSIWLAGAWSWTALPEWNSVTKGFWCHNVALPAAFDSVSSKIKYWHECLNTFNTLSHPHPHPCHHKSSLILWETESRNPEQIDPCSGLLQKDGGATWLPPYSLCKHKCLFLANDDMDRFKCYTLDL